MMNFEKKFFLPFLKYPKKCKFDGQTLIKVIFLEGRLPKYCFFRKCSSGGNRSVAHVLSVLLIFQRIR